MDAANNVRAQCRVHGPVTGNAAFSFEFNAAQQNIKVTLARLRRTCVPGMAGAVINHFDLADIKRVSQPVFDFLSH